MEGEDEGIDLNGREEPESSGQYAVANYTDEDLVRGSHDAPKFGGEQGEDRTSTLVTKPRDCHQVTLIWRGGCAFRTS